MLYLQFTDPLGAARMESLIRGLVTAFPCVHLGRLGLDLSVGAPATQYHRGFPTGRLTSGDPPHADRRRHRQRENRGERSAGSSKAPYAIR